MQTDVQKPDAYRIPDTLTGTILRSQTTPDTYSVEELLTAARMRYDCEYRRRARYALGQPIPEQTAEETVRRQQSVMMRQHTLDKRAKDAERQRNKRHRDAVKAGRTVRSYRKRR